MVLLMVSVLSLSQYEETLIEAKLQNFDTEMQLVSEAIAEVAIQNGALNIEQAQIMTRRLIETAIPQRIRVFNDDGLLIVDSKTFKNRRPSLAVQTKKIRISTQPLKNMARVITGFLPNKRALPLYPMKDKNSAKDLPDASTAINGMHALSAWSDEGGRVFLSGASPLYKNNIQTGAVLLTRSAHDINDAIGDMWLNIVIAFVITLIMTILISIYLAGVISSPLKKLAKAAEGVRKGKLSYEDIPDFSARNDEIGELSLSFREMTNALWDRMDSIEKFSADVAHELKNPLTSLKSAVETVSIVKNKKDREKLMNIIKHDIDRLDRLIADISHASRLDSELSRDVYRRVNLCEVLSNLLGSYKNPLDNSAKPKTFNGVHIEFNSGTDQDIYVWGLESRLEQIFQNLLSNALSFSEKEHTISILLDQGKSLIRIIFEDEGPGIPEENLESIFERFYTQRPAHESFGQHSGLGLSICKQIVSAMDGEIYAENITNEKGAVSGARFSVLLKKH